MRTAAKTANVGDDLGDFGGVKAASLGLLEPRAAGCREDGTGAAAIGCGFCVDAETEDARDGTLASVSGESMGVGDSVAGLRGCLTFPAAKNMNARDAIIMIMEIWWNATLSPCALWTNVMASS